LKRFLLTGFMLVTLFTTVSGQWEIIGEEVTGNFKTMDFANGNIGWIAGENGSMVKTEDGGKTWFSLPLDSSWQFDMIDFVNDSVGWAIGWEKNNGKNDH